MLVYIYQNEFGLKPHQTAKLLILTFRGKYIIDRNRQK